MGYVGRGSSTQVLTDNTAGDLPNFKPGGGGGSGALTLIQTQTATLVTSLTFTTGITPSFNNYILIATGVTDPTFLGTYFGLQISSDGGATYINTGYLVGNSNQTVIPLIGLEAGATNPNFASFLAALLNFTSGSGFVVVSDIGAIYVNDSSPNISGTTLGAGYGTPNFIVNAFQLVADDATPFSGTFSLYGLSM